MQGKCVGPDVAVYKHYEGKMCRGRSGVIKLKFSLIAVVTYM